MTDERGPVFEFGPFVLDPQNRTLSKEGRLLRLEPMPFDLLCLLVERPGELIDRETIRSTLWKGQSHGEFDTRISRCVKEIRRALGDSRAAAGFVETVRGKGYRFLADVQLRQLEPLPHPATARPSKKRRRLSAVGLAAALLLGLALGLQPSTPRTDPNRFTILVAPFENDRNGEYETLVIESLGEILIQTNAIQVLRHPEVIGRSGLDPEEASRRAHARARAVLAESGADVLIWGSIFSFQDASRPKLYWTPSKSLQLRRDWGRYDPTEELDLPPRFRDDLIEILKLLVVAHGAEFHGLEGSHLVEELEPFVERVRRLLRGLVAVEDGEDETTARVRGTLASALTILGRQSGRREALVEAIEGFRENSAVFDDAGLERDWAETQNNLGIALRELGAQDGTLSMFEEAASAHRRALSVFTLEETPRDWAMTQNNLGRARWHLGWFGGGERGKAWLHDALRAHASALEVFTEEAAPLDWAYTQDCVGQTRSALSWREPGESARQQLRLAIDAFRVASRGLDRRRVPVTWASYRSHLGIALWSLGERDFDTKHLLEAVSAHREALEELTRERVPNLWARAENNLGIALWTLGTREKSADHLRDAVAAYRAVLLEHRRDRTPGDWAATQLNLGLALNSLGEIEPGTASLEAADIAFRNALDQWTLEEATFHRARALGGWCETLGMLGEKTGALERFVEAENACEAALEIFTRDDAPLYWAPVQVNLGRARRDRGARIRDAALICTGLESLAGAWEVFHSADSRFDAERARRHLEDAVTLLRSRFAPGESARCLSSHSEVLRKLALEPSAVLEN